ncbi:MAG: glycoside hydrolase family 3 C-terminal domain-containing protein [Oscillospiraceae bacterium]|nr:glycoside hydrolase family 3 C-terminal domain-containing protein [Oscillospiraceae bacterium]
MVNENECRKRAEELVFQMSMEERIDQLTYQAPAISRLNVPSYNYWNEALHGVARGGTATVFPQAIALAASFDEELMSDIADTVGTEARAKFNEAVKHGDRDIYKGLTFWSPNVNIFRDPRWGRGHETYGEDPVLTTRLGVAFIKGLQGEGETMKAAACAKHFAVHSGPEDVRHEFDAIVSEKDLRETYLPAFEACVKEAGVESVMGAYNRVNGEPCCGSYRLLRDILRKEWGFTGHVVSDCWAIRDFHTFHRVTKTPVESAALAINAGCDLNCGNTYLHLKSAWMQGMVPDEKITEATIRLFTMRYKLGLFEKTEFDTIPYEKVECKEHIDLSVKAAEKSIVLLRNNGILPLDANAILTVGVIGPNANSRKALIGNYYGTASRYITPLEGIQDALEGKARVLYSAGCELKADRSEVLALPGDRISEACTVAEHSDVVILFLGLDESLEGEELDVGNNCGSGDKQDLLLPAVQRDLLVRVVQTGKPVIVCLMAGSSIDLDYADRNCSAVLQAWYPGAQGGKAIANILFGYSAPGGKLPVTFYRSENTLPEFTDYSMKGRTYRYITEKPLYPFGYGLIYGKAEIVKAETSGTIPVEGALPVRVSLRNVSDREVDEVIQIYAKPDDCRLAPPNPVLCAFRRVKLLPRTDAEFVVNVPAETFLVVDEEGQRVRPESDWTLFVGFCQPDERSAELTGSRPACVAVKS